MLTAAKISIARCKPPALAGFAAGGSNEMRNDVGSIVSLSPDNGAAAGGTAVTITVTGAMGNPRVTFGGTAATSVVVVNSVTITCVTPAHAGGAVDVIVGTVTAAGAYTYT